jgi:antitoxin MazE
MSSDTILKAMFIQQRLQIMHIGKHHDEYTDSYLYAWESSVYPTLSDTDGSVPEMPHEPYEKFFKIPKNKVDFLLKRLDNAWLKKENITFYGLEDELNVRSMTSSGWERTELLHICKYFYLNNLFDNAFWRALVANGQCPSEAHSIIDTFDRTQDIYFM